MDQLDLLTESGKALGVRSFYSGDPDVIKSCLTFFTLSVWLRLCIARSLVLRIFSIPKCSTLGIRELCRVACRDSDQLASSLVRALLLIRKT